jgi:hypothetical protein
LFIALAPILEGCTTETPSALMSLAGATPTPVVVATAMAVATPAAFTFGDGTYQIGGDLQAGTYEALHAGTNFSPCVWQRLSGLGGSEQEIIASGSDHDGTAIVTIAKSDKGFDTNHCGTWAAPTAITASPTTPFSNGAYIVGLDIAAGTWQSATLQRAQRAFRCVAPGSA